MDRLDWDSEMRVDELFEAADANQEMMDYLHAEAETMVAQHDDSRPHQEE